MHRLLVLSGLAAAFVSIAGIASAAGASSSHDAIGSVIVGKAGDRAADYWTPSRLAAVSELPLPVIRARGDGAPQP